MRSTTVTSTGARRRARAANKPPNPPPTITTRWRAVDAGFTRCIRLAALERRLSLLDERCDAFPEVGGLGHITLDLGLELELLAHTRVQPVVELALDAGVGARWAGGEPRDERVDLVLELVVG